MQCFILWCTKQYLCIEISTPNVTVIISIFLCVCVRENVFIHSFLQCIKTIKSCCCFSFFFSAPADPLAEDEATHTTGNGVVSEVGDVQAHVYAELCLCLFSLLSGFNRIFLPLCISRQGMLQGRMATVTATVMTTMTTSALQLET